MASTNVETRTQVLHQQRLKALSEKEDTVVYVYGHDVSTDTMPPEEQCDMLKEIVAIFDEGCKLLPRASDEHLREAVMSTDDKYRRFQRLYPLVFASVTRRAKDDEGVRQLDKARKLAMLFILEQWKGNGSEDDKKARALNVALRLSLKGDSSEPVVIAEGAPPVQPMAASALGTSTVNQK